MLQSLKEDDARCTVPGGTAARDQEQDRTLEQSSDNDVPSLMGVTSHVCPTCHQATRPPASPPRSESFQPSSSPPSNPSSPLSPTANHPSGNLGQSPSSCSEPLHRELQDSLNVAKLETRALTSRLNKCRADTEELLQAVVYLRGRQGEEQGRQGEGGRLGKEQGRQGERGEQGKASEKEQIPEPNKAQATAQSTTQDQSPLSATPSTNQNAVKLSESESVASAADELLRIDDVIARTRARYSLNSENVHSRDARSSSTVPGPPPRSDSSLGNLSEVNATLVGEVEKLKLREAELEELNGTLRVELTRVRRGRMERGEGCVVDDETDGAFIPCWFCIFSLWTTYSIFKINL